MVTIMVIIGTKFFPLCLYIFLCKGSHDSSVHILHRKSETILSASGMDFYYMALD